MSILTMMIIDAKPIAIARVLFIRFIETPGKNFFYAYIILYDGRIINCGY